MIRTGISVSTWEAEGEDVILTAFKLLSASDDPEPTDDEIRAAWGV